MNLASKTRGARDRSRASFDVLDLNLSAAKGALHRGRTRLRQLAQETEDTPPQI
jgi:hypothetical protein